MSGIVGSKINIRGSGLIDKLGTDGQVFTSAGLGLPPTFAAAGGGAWTKIKSQEITSSTASMDFVNGTDSVVFDSTYDYYVIQFRNLVQDTTDVRMSIEISLDTGSTYKSSGYETWTYETGFSTASNRTAQTDSMVSTHQIPTTAGEGGMGFIMLTSPAESTLYPACVYIMTLPQDTQNSELLSLFGGGQYNTTTAYDGFRFIPSSGTFTTLQAILYGHAD